MLELFARKIESFSFSSITPEALRKAKLQIANMLAAYFASFHIKENAFSRASTLYQSREKTIFVPYGKRMALSSALFQYSTRSMMLDYDDFLMAGHTGHSTVFFPLSALLPFRLSGKDFLTLQVLGNEAEARLGLSVLLGPLNGQMWSFIHSFGVAAMLARLHDLPLSRLKALLSFSLAFPHHLLPAAFFASHAKYLAASYPSLYGLQCFEWVQSGARASDQIFAREGFIAQFSARSLEKVFASPFLFTETLSYKPYPGCAYMDGALDCLLALKRKNGKTFPEKVVVYGNLFTSWMQKWGEAFVSFGFPHTLNFQVPFNLALGWYHGDLKAKHFVKPPPVVERWQKKVSVRHDPALTAMMLKKGLELSRFLSGWRKKAFLADLLERSLQVKAPQLADLLYSKKASGKVSSEFLAIPFPCRVEISISGRKQVCQTMYPRGFYGRSLSSQEAVVKQKFYGELSAFYPQDTIDTLWQMLMKLEDCDLPGLKEGVDLMCESFNPSKNITVF